PRPREPGPDRPRSRRRPDPHPPHPPRPQAGRDQPPGSRAAARSTGEPGQGRALRGLRAQGAVYCATKAPMFLAAAVQLTSTSDEEANWESARALIERAAGYGARFVATPENT